MKIGMIGLGRMGGPICRNLAAVDGFSVRAYDINPATVSAYADAGVQPAPDIATLVADCDVIVVSLPTPQHVEEVVLGTNGVAANAKAGAVLIDLSTNSPGTARQMAEGLKAVGVELLEAPVTGGIAKATDGSLTIMVGGDAAVLQDKKSVFDAISSRAIHVGDVGAASVIKLVNNMLFIGAVTLASEGLAIAQAAGVNLQKLSEIVNAGSGGSIGYRVLAYRAALGDYAPQFALDLAYKDLRLAMDLEEEHGVSGMMAAAALDLLRRARAKGLGSEDLVAVMKVHDRAQVAS